MPGPADRPLSWISCACCCGPRVGRIACRVRSIPRRTACVTCSQVGRAISIRCRSRLTACSRGTALRSIPSRCRRWAGSSATNKVAAEEILRDAIHMRLDALEGDRKVMLKLTIPSVPALYAPLIGHARVQRVVALSGGYSRHEACRLLAASHGMIASFSRALIDDLRASMSDAAFDTALREAIDEIYQASVHKT